MACVHYKMHTSHKILYMHQTFTVTSLEKNALKITDCVPHWNGSLFNYTIHWTVPQYIAYGSGIFSEFSLTADKVQIAKRFIRSESVQKIANEMSYNYTWIDFKPLHSSYKYEFKVIIVTGSSYIRYEFISVDTNSMMMPYAGVHSVERVPYT